MRPAGSVPTEGKILKPTTVAMIGAGGIARPHLRAWRDLGVPVVVYSLAGARELVQEAGYGMVVDSEEAALRACDLVDIVTPTNTHFSIAARALNAGKDVICEKPLALTSEDAAQLVAMAEAAGRHLFPAHVVRFFPAYAALREAVKDGQIGTPAIARFFRTGPFPAWAPWFGEADRSGGVILDLMLHDLDFAQWLMGPVEEVYATVAVRDSNPPLQIGQVSLRHAGGAISLVRGTWGAPSLTFSSSFHVGGTDGTLAYDSAAGESFAVMLPADDAENVAVPLAASPDGTSPYTLEMESFLRVREGTASPVVTAADAVEAIALARAALESAASGQPAKVGSK